MGLYKLAAGLPMAELAYFKTISRRKNLRGAEGCGLCPHQNRTDQRRLNHTTTTGVLTRRKINIGDDQRHDGVARL